MDEEKKRQFMEKRCRYQLNMQHLNNDIKIANQQAEHWQAESVRIADTLTNSEQIIAELADEFRYGSVLTGHDMTFLFFATALQCCRWLFQPKVTMHFEQISKNERHNSGVDGRQEFMMGKKEAEKNVESNIKSSKYPDKVNMFLLAVPYDVMQGTDKIEIPGVSGIGKNISGVNHHAATMGHDPILGYIFGTINIMSRTVTFKTPVLNTNLVHLHQGSNKNQYVGREVGFPEALKRAMESASEDITRIPAAILRQTMHMQSDKYTKSGLPIPFLSPAKAQELLNQGWNSYELERFAKFLLRNTAVVGVQAALSMLINVAIETLHRITYDVRRDGDQKLFEVRTRKILIYSNVLASSSNIIYTAIKKDINSLDIGGFLITLYRIATDTKVIRQIREEYVYGGYEKMLELREFNI